MKRALLLLAALAAFAGFGYTPVAYTNSFTRDGVTYVQRGALGTSDYVATNIDSFAVGKVQSVNGKTGDVVLAAKDVGAVPTNVTEEVKVHLSEKLELLPNNSTNGIRLSVSGTSITASIDTNVNVVGLTPETVGALPNNQASLEANENFRAAVATVSPPVELPDYWSVTALTNSDGIAVDGDGYIYLRSSDTRWQIEDNGLMKCLSKNNDGHQVYWSFNGYNIYLKWYEDGQAKTKTVPVSMALMPTDVKQSDQRGTSYSTYPISSDAMTAFLQPYITAYTASQTYQTLTGMSDYQTVAGMSAYQTTAGMSNYETTANAAMKLEQAKNYANTLVSTSKVDKIYTSDARQYMNALGQVYEQTSIKQWHVYSSYSQVTVDFVITDTPKIWYSTTKLDNINMRIRQEQAGYSLEGLNGGYWRSLGFSSGNDQTTSLSFAADSWTATAYTEQGGAWTQTKQVAYSNEVEAVLEGYVPTTRKVNGQALTSDITIQGMTTNAVVFTNGTLKTYDGRTVDAMDYTAMTNTVNEVKAKFYDQPLQVEWTVRMVNGDMKLYATTNVNTSVLNN